MTLSLPAVIRVLTASVPGRGIPLLPSLCLTPVWSVAGGRLAHNDDIMMEEEYDPRLGLYSILYSQMWLNDDEGKSEEIFWECLTVFWSSGVRPLGTRGEFIIKRIATVDGGTGQASTGARTQTV